jgi:hypothetical protein
MNLPRKSGVPFVPSHIFQLTGSAAVPAKATMVPMGQNQATLASNLSASDWDVAGHWTSGSVGSA